MYAVQGPKSLDMINALVETPVDGQKFFQILPNRIDGIDVLINRAGFTGEKLWASNQINISARNSVETQYLSSAIRITTTSHRRKAGL